MSDNDALYKKTKVICNISDKLRTALDMVEGYMVDPDKPWCAPFARSEPNFSVKVALAIMRVLMFVVVVIASNDDVVQPP